MVSIALVGVMISVHGYICPFKAKSNNILELFLLLNLLILLVVSIYNTPNAIEVDILIALAFLQLMYIMLKRLLQYSRIKCNCCVGTFKGAIVKCFWRKGPPQPQSYQLRNIVPDVAYKYSEFQEPLIGVN